MAFDLLFEVSKPTKPLSTATVGGSRRGGGDSTCQGVPEMATVRDGRKIFSGETTNRFCRFSRFLTLRRKNCFTYKKKVKKEEGNKR